MTEWPKWCVEVCGRYGMSWVTELGWWYVSGIASVETLMFTYYLPHMGHTAHQYAHITIRGYRYLCDRHTLVSRIHNIHHTHPRALRPTHRVLCRLCLCTLGVCGVGVMTLLVNM